MDPMVFDLEPIEIPTKIGKDDFLLCEASEGAAVQYRNASLKALKVADGKIVGFGGSAETEPLLVSLCIFKMPGREQVSQDTVRSWPAKIVKKLFDKVKEISDLAEKAETLEELTKQINDLQRKRHTILTENEETKKLESDLLIGTSDTQQA